MLEIKVIEEGLYQKIREVIPTVCVDLLVTRPAPHDAFLLVKRTERPAKGEWWFPGGRILKWEEYRETAIRKAQEELGIDVTLGRTVSIEDYFAEEDGYHTVNIVVHAMCYNDTIKLKNDHSGYEWVEKVSEDLLPCIKNPLLMYGFEPAHPQSSSY